MKCTCEPCSACEGRGEVPERPFRRYDPSQYNGDWADPYHKAKTLLAEKAIGGL